MNVKEFILSKIGEVPFFKTMSMQLEMTNETGSRLRIKYEDKYQNIRGSVHGGVIASLVDATCGLSVNKHAIITLCRLCCNGSVIHYCRCLFLGNTRRLFLGR